MVGRPISVFSIVDADGSWVSPFFDMAVGGWVIAALSRLRLDVGLVAISVIDRRGSAVVRGALGPSLFCIVSICLLIMGRIIC